ncbi:lysozyme inhibitor LprI family protein [Mucilaginibacter sp. 44-25]|uniref:lysozyme inhibitor LprI family protein n=1 Tax=Mucilaginibacter sp. 44-25 TaxID=1895794 RepID=UPI00095BC260|nr:lysozyme inhibitor LprI family protein [Mucilaginibacter sp. 44-25]OJW12653.1 MAG: hypothetical protein BGO48_05945 [Mucilaginibacter sp. 44-25]
MFRKLLLPFIVAVLFTGTLHAQSVDCSNAKTQLEMNLCAQKQFNAADKELNTLYKTLMGRLAPELKTALTLSQRKWVAFRDEEAKIYALLYEGGSMAPLAVYNSKTQSTQARIKQLKDLYEETDH